MEKEYITKKFLLDTDILISYKLIQDKEDNWEDKYIFYVEDKDLQAKNKRLFQINLKDNTAMHFSEKQAIKIAEFILTELIKEYENDREKHDMEMPKMP